MLLKNLGYNDGDIQTLNLLAIVRQRDILTIRDLNASHLPLLKNIRRTGLKAISDTFKVEPRFFRAFFHYQP